MNPRFELLEAMTGKLRTGVPFSYVKRGDGEEFCMAGAVGGNCDGHPYSPELGILLEKAFAFFKKQPSVRVVGWGEQDVYQSLLHVEGFDMQPTATFWLTVRDSIRKKIFVGPDRLAGAAHFLNAKHVVIPTLNAFSSYAGIRSQLLALTRSCSPEYGTIVVFAAGMPAKAWIADILRATPSATCIDAGSAFDPMFVGNSRSGQLGKRDARAPYQAVLPPLVHAVIFSKDRAMQLDALLRSMHHWVPEFWPPTVHWMASNNAFYAAYETLMAENQWCRWVPQVRATFTPDLLSCLETDRQLAGLFCDDDVFFREPESFTVEPGTCQSLRFGEGTSDGATPEFLAAAKPCSGPGPELRGYSLDGNVHRAGELRAVIRHAQAASPSTLEASMNRYCPKMTEKRLHRSCLVSIPHNLVQNDFPDNPNMGGKAADLNRRYLAGERIDLDAMDFSNVTDAHQFIPYKFKRK